MQVDSIVRFRDGISRYIITAIDLVSGFASAHGYSSLSSKSALDFFEKLEKVAPFKVSAIQTDNGSEFEKHFREHLERSKIRHPQLNAKARTEVVPTAITRPPRRLAAPIFSTVDGSMLAQLSTPDMCLPIQYALTYPERVTSDRVQTSLARFGSLTFEEPDPKRFPALTLARRAGELGGTLPAVLNAANEVAVDAFVNRKLSFLQIPELVRQTMEQHEFVPHPTLEQILAADAWARRAATVH